MIDPRPLSNDLTDQGKYQLAHGEPSTTHTPGPWVLGRFQPRTTVTSDDRILPLLVAEIQTGDGEGKANARLIAAAPDLLKQLEAARQYVGKVAADHDGTTVGRLAGRRLDRMDAAIAKATGGDS